MGVDLRQLWSGRYDDTPLPGGKFDGHLTFVQSLTEALKNVPRALLVVSLPASDSVRDMGAGIVDNVHEIEARPGWKRSAACGRLSTGWRRHGNSHARGVLRDCAQAAA